MTMSNPENSLYVEKARGLAQCELFLMKTEAGKMEALVYNTTGLNDCPPGQVRSDGCQSAGTTDQIGCCMEKPPALLDDGSSDDCTGWKTPRLLRSPF